MSKKNDLLATTPVPTTGSEHEKCGRTVELGEGQWIKVGTNPLRYDYGRPNDDPGSPKLTDQITYVEEEKHSSYFHWKTYGSHEKGVKLAGRTSVSFRYTLK